MLNRVLYMWGQMALALRVLTFWYVLSTAKPQGKKDMSARDLLNGIFAWFAQGLVRCSQSARRWGVSFFRFNPHHYRALLSLVFFFLRPMYRVAALRFSKGRFYAVFGVSSIFLG